MHKNFAPVKALNLFAQPILKNSWIYLAVFWLVMIDATETHAQVIWNSGSLTFSYTAPGQQDCITAQTCLTRTTVLFNSVCQTVSGSQGCSYPGPCNTEWAYGDIANWNTLTYQPLYTVNACSPPSMVGNPLVLHLISENIYLQLTFNTWTSGTNGAFSYTRTTMPTLPITLSAFSGRQSGNINVLHWTSSSELNFSHYNVQCSRNGSDFLTLSRVDSKSEGNSNIELDYDFTDSHPAPGHNYYRLEQLDIDGKTEYSKVIDLFNSSSGSTIYIHQNDGSALVNVNIESVKSSAATINLVDMNGRIVQTLNKGIVDGNNIVPLSLDNVAKGIYLVQVHEDGYLSFSGKVIRH